MKIKKIILEGNLTVKNVDKILESIKKSVSENEKIEIDARIHNDIDLSGIQLLIVLKKFSIIHKNKISLKLNMGKDNKILMDRTGFKELLVNISDN